MFLLTGATGLLGAHVLERGLSLGHSFRTVARSTPRRSFVATVSHQIDIRACDLVAASGTELDSILQGIHTVIHCAGRASPFPKDEEAMHALHVDATKRLYERAASQGVSKWVHVSSIATLSGSGAESITEVGAPRDTPYARSKAQADSFFDSAHRIPVLTIHPAFMLGRWDARPSSGALLMAIRMGRLRSYVNCIKNVVAASDVARGIFQALECDTTGHYLLGGVNIPIGDLLQIAAVALGLGATYQPTELATIDSIRDDLSDESYMIRELCTPSATSSEKARKAFGYAPMVDVPSMIRETLDYFAEYKMLLPKRSRPMGGGA